MRVSGLLFPLLLIFGCGRAEESPPPTMMNQFAIPPTPSAEAGFQLVLPVVPAIPAGSSQELCTWTDKVLERDTSIAELVGAQAGPGHHIIVYVTMMQQPPGTRRECTDADMVNFTYVAAAIGEGATGLNKPPAGLAFFIPQGAQIVINEHYLNASPQPRDGQAAVNIYYADPSRSYIRSSALSFADTRIMVPPGESSADVNCTVQDELAAWLFFPHMHEWGKHILIERQSHGVTTTLFDTDWSDAYTFHPPELQQTLDAPLRFSAGDSVHIRCTWNNTTGQPMIFGQEMCVGSGQIIDRDARGAAFCINGNWTH